MVSLTRYFLMFFIICLVMTCICGVVAALLPQGLGGILTIVPYLVAMIVVLFRFLKNMRRAPTQAERKKITLGFTLIFWLYNFSFLLIGIAIFSRHDPEIWQNLLLYIQHPQFISIMIIMLMLMAIPSYLLTYWFFGPQAKRMAIKMFGE